MLPQDVANRAFDVLPGVRKTIGSFADGTDESEAVRRIYGPTLRQLLRAAAWDWARKRSPLFLLGDATGQSPQASNIVEYPWIYAYAWPNDCVRARWLPWTGVPPGALAASGFAPLPGSANWFPSNPEVPIMTGANIISPGLSPFERPARFLVSSSDQYPSQVGVVDWPNIPDFDDSEGVGPVNRRIILTNVPPGITQPGALPGPYLVYTALALEIELWDALFTQATVHTLASLLAPVVIADPKLAIAERNAHIGIAKMAIADARVASAQEAGFRQTTDHVADWTRARRTGFARWGAQGAAGGWGSWGPGVYDGGWDAMTWSDGSVY